MLVIGRYRGRGACCWGIWRKGMFVIWGLERGDAHYLVYGGRGCTLFGGLEKGGAHYGGYRGTGCSFFGMWRDGCSLSGVWREGMLFFGS